MIGSDSLDLRRPTPKIGHSLLSHPQCRLTRITCSDLTELFLSCRPDPHSGRDLASQVRSLYEGIFKCLMAEGASPAHAVMEKVFFRDVTAGREVLSSLKARDSNGFQWGVYSPASILVEEPPSGEGELCGAQLQVVIPASNRPARWSSFSSAQPAQNGTRSCDPAVGKSFSLEGRQQIWIGNILGKPGGDFYSEALSMFEAADHILASQHVSFSQVARTWIYLREMERDYANLNRARRTFFQKRGVERRPASTGIGGSPPGVAHRVALCLYALTGEGPGAVETMHTPTLNEAHVYGSDFSRGMSVVEGGRKTLYISGTASVDEAGGTVAVGDFDAQVERMLLNVEMLLDGEGASFESLSSAITYLKDPRTASRFRELLARRKIPDFPHDIVKAEVCRPELLCEIEAIAVLPAPSPNRKLPFDGRSS